jgi:hypothetical protein
MKLFKLLMGALSFIGVAFIALASWALAVVWWYSADVSSSMRRK